MEEKEIEFIDYLRVIWKWKSLILGGTLTATFLSIIIALVLPKIYRASVTFLVTTSPVILESENIPSEKNFILLVETYRGIIKNKQCLSETIEKFKLQDIKPRINLDKMEKVVQVKSIPNSKLLRLDVELREPVLAKDVANYIAEKAVALNTRLSHGDTIEAQKFLNVEVNKVEEELLSAEKDLLKFEKQAKMMDIRKESGTILDIKSTLAKEYSTAEVDLISEQGKLKRLEQEIHARQPKMTLSRSMAEDPMLMQFFSALAGNNSKEVLRLKFDSEVVNESYGLLDQKLVSSRAQFDYLEARKTILKDALKTLNKNSDFIQTKLAQQEVEETKLKNKYELASTIYEDFRKKLDAANINIIAGSQDIKILDPAIVPFSPVKPRKKVIVILTFLLSGIGFTTIAFFMEYLKQTGISDNVHLK